jgi:hypothetical protein
MKARVLASAPEDRLRDGKAAVETIRKAGDIVGYTQFPIVEGMAAANAEAGNFDEAVKWGKKAVSLAPEESKQDARDRLELYKAKKPYRMKTPPQDKE